MKCECGGKIAVSHNARFGDVGFCLVCNKWYEKEDLEMVRAKNVTQALIEKVGTGNDLK